MITAIHEQTIDKIEDTGVKGHSLWCTSLFRKSTTQNVTSECNTAK